MLSASSTSPSPARLRLIRWGRLSLILGHIVFVAATAKAWSPGLQVWLDAEKPKLLDLAHGSWWLAALINALLLTLLALTSRWWLRASSAESAETSPAKPTWRFWLGLLIILGIAVAVRVPRLELSLYNDESYAFRTHIAGSYSDASPDSRGDAELPAFKPQSWLGTLNHNRQGNNSPLFSALARVSYDLWLSQSGQARGVIHEPSLRLPVLVAAVLGIALLALFARRLGGSRLALIVAMLAALHPWHVRYSVEARCYGLLFLLLPLLALALDKAWSTGRWRWWLVVAVTQALTLNCFFGCVFTLALLNGVLALASLIAWRRGASDLHRLAQLIVSGVLAVMLYLQTSLPVFIQNQRFLDQTTVLQGKFDASWFADLGSLLLSGLPALDLDPTNPQALSWQRNWMTSSMWDKARLLSLIVFLLAILVNHARRQHLARRAAASATPRQPLLPSHRLHARAFILASFGGLALTILLFMAKGLVLLSWYGIFTLPAFLLAVGWGLEKLSQAIEHDWPKDTGAFLGHAAWTVLLPSAVLLFHHWESALDLYGRVSRENLRGPIEHVRQKPYPALLQDREDVRLACFWSNSPIYDPRIVPLWQLADLQTMIAAARRDRRPLYVEHAFSANARREQPEIFALVHNPEVFEPIVTFTGLDYEMSTHYLYRLKQP